MKKFSLEVLLLLTLVMVSHAVQLNNRWGFKSSHSLLNPNFIHNKFLIKKSRNNKGLKFIPEQLLFIYIGKHLLKAEGIENRSNTTLHIGIMGNKRQF